MIEKNGRIVEPPRSNIFVGGDKTNLILSPNAVSLKYIHTVCKVKTKEMEEMEGLVTKYDVDKRDLARGRNLKIAAFSAPIIFPLIPFIVSLAIFILFGTSPPIAATIFFFGFLITLIGFLLGLGISGFLALRYAKWKKEMRERIAADGIKANEIEWFKNELRPGEKRILKEIGQSDPILADHFRESLAARLTSTRVLRSAKRELAAAHRREEKIKRLGSGDTEKYLNDIKGDLERLRHIKDEAQQMLAESETRLQMIEAAALRGTSLADSELALKKLAARAESLPLELEKSKLTREISEELENKDLLPGGN